MPPLKQFKTKPVYADRRVHWLAGNVVVWYDPDSDHTGVDRGRKGEPTKCGDYRHVER
jgi:hypothetical protein